MKAGQCTSNSEHTNILPYARASKGIRQGRTASEIRKRKLFGACIKRTRARVCVC